MEQLPTIAYALTCQDGKGNAVYQEAAMLEDLDRIFPQLLEFVSIDQINAWFDDAVEKTIAPHYVQDMIEPELTWELRAYFTLPILDQCPTTCCS